jgi:APA family basic amino acid/polyamine antiporter
MKWPAAFISLGAVFATTSVLVVFQLGQPRIFFSMARDGLLPQWAARVHPRYRTPHVTTVLTGVAVAFFAGLLNIGEVVELTNIGTLFAFVLVCVGIIVLRFKEPERPRPFRVPLGPWLLPVMGAASCIYLMVFLPPASWWRFVGWLVVGMAIYFSYGYSRSVVGRELGRPARTPATLQAAGLGFLLLAVGLFTIPHDASLPTLLIDALPPPPTNIVNSLPPVPPSEHLRALAGLLIVAGGLVLGAGGLLVEWLRPSPASRR